MSPKAVEPDWLISVTVVEMISNVFASIAPETISVPVTNRVLSVNVRLAEPEIPPDPVWNCSELIGPCPSAPPPPPEPDAKRTSA